MATSYMTIYNRFLDKVTDYFIFDLSDEDTCNYCHRLMTSALANLSDISHNLSDMDEEAHCFNADLDNREIEYIACRMACEWVDPQINNTTLTRQYIGTKDRICPLLQQCRSEHIAQNGKTPEVDNTVGNAC